MKIVVSFQGLLPDVEMWISMIDGSDSSIENILKLLISPAYHQHMSWFVDSEDHQENVSVKNSRPGRPPTTLARIPSKFKRIYPRYKNGELNICQVAKLCDISRPTVYKYIRILEGEQDAGSD